MEQEFEGMDPFTVVTVIYAVLCAFAMLLVGVAFFTAIGMYIIQLFTPLLKHKTV